MCVCVCFFLYALNMRQFRPKVFLRFKYFSEKINSKNNSVTSEGVVSHNDVYYVTMFEYQTSSVPSIRHFEVWLIVALGLGNT